MPTIQEEVDAIERDSATRSLADLVSYLADHLGRQAVAYVAGLKDAQMLGDWMRGTEPRSAMTRSRVRYAYQASRMLIDAFDDATAEAWFFGSNSRLDDEAPAWILRNAQSIDDLRTVIPAVKAFVRPPE